jgi:hypothetical protein
MTTLLIFFEGNNVPISWLNKREFGYLKGAALKKAERIVDKLAGINISGEYGSIEIDESDFIPSPDK